MSSSISSVARAKSSLGVASRRGDPQRIADARRELAVANMAAFIKRTLATAPPLTDEQRASVARLLRGGDAA